ncbi:MAG: hypothetical protein JXR37_22385 [Kiritimatiellae bacterium]|nr:hypothetical protein [Kiritimatiellia bacterium]
MRRIICVCAILLLGVGPVRAQEPPGADPAPVPGVVDGPRFAPDEIEAIVARHVAAPEHYDIFFGKKDRQYLTGAWKLKWEWNFLTADWIAANMTASTGKPGLVLKKGVSIPHRPIAASPQHLAPDADLSQWWDVLVPGSWNERQPGEKPNSRAIGDYAKLRDAYYAFGGIGFYRRTFDVPITKARRRVLLHFDSVDNECVVWVNGKRVGEHRNWKPTGRGRSTGVFLDAFDMEITEAVRFGQPNVLTVGVYDTGIPLLWQFPKPGGITGRVWMEYAAPAYSAETLITAPHGTGKIRVTVLAAGGTDFPASVNVEVRPWDSPFYTFPGRLKKAWHATVALSAPDAEGRRGFELDVPQILAWDVDEPNLYELRITDNSGMTLALERFGVRSIGVKGRHFLLNGRPVYFFGHCPGGSIAANWGEAPGVMTKEAYNHNNAARDWFRMQREANFTSMRVHTGPEHRLAYYLCDEVGLMVRDEWTPSALTPLPPERQVSDYLGTHDVSASFMPDRSAFLPDLQAGLKRWIRHAYNSPCVVTWCGGNEMAAGDANIRLYAKLLHEFLHAHDPQQRPVTPSSGLHWEQGDPLLRRQPLPADFLDYHNYGMIFAGWPAAPALYKAEYDALVQGVYAGKPVPVINGEWLMHSGKERRLCVTAPEVFDEAGNPRPGEYLKLIDDLWAKRGPYTHARTANEFLRRIAAGGSRVARGYVEDAEARARWYGRGIEIFRRDCPREAGYSAFALQHFLWLKPDAGKKRLDSVYGSPEIEAIRMAQQPLIAIPDSWQEHVMAGDTLACRVHVVNWSGQPFEGKLDVRLERAEAECVGRAELGVPAVGIGERRVLPVSLPVAAHAAPGEYRLVFDLDAKGRNLSRNVHRALVRSRAEFAPIDTTRAVGLYELGGGRDTAAGLLRVCGVKARRFVKFEEAADLSEFDVLVIGRDSIGADVSRNAGALRAFVEAGGRLVVFEQGLRAQVPWAPALSYVSAGAIALADPIPLAHPVFEGMQPLDFEDWGETHTVADVTLFPPGESVLAAGMLPRVGNDGRRSPHDFGMTLAEFRMGKGRCLLCQLNVACNYAVDSAACALGYNILRYVLSDAHDPAAVPALKDDKGDVCEDGVWDPDDVYMVDLGDAANSTLADADGSGFMGLGEGLGDLPSGVTRFGGVPFRVLDTWKQRPFNCIVLGSTERQAKVFPLVGKSVKIGVKLAKLCLLQTATWVTAGAGEELAHGTIRYLDGSAADFAIRNGVELADWWAPRPLPGATVAWISGGAKGVYLTQWVNPHPDRVIDGITLSASTHGYVGVLGITGVVSMKSEE